MRFRAAFFSSLIAVGVGVGPALAHHSFQMFDQETSLLLTGTVTEFQWANPHVWIQVNIPTADETLEEWSIEGGGPNILARAGWRPSTFEAGDEVMMLVHPMRDGSKAGSFIGAKFADGTTVGDWSDEQEL